MNIIFSKELIAIIFLHLSKIHLIQRAFRICNHGKIPINLTNIIIYRFQDTKNIHKH